ncbi:MAG: hypothetical protein LBU95_02880 [Rikenellaceae bacterium]|jgi:hypothetical protein|nr:hypothetical protein [Rikenellaceae bacterium]
MQIRKEVLTALVALAVPMVAASQASSINTFSPYTMYGIGDVNIQGTTDILSMGGAGTAFRAAGSNRINYLNPASYSNGRRNSFLINFGMQGTGYSLKSETTKSGFNTFNINNVAIQFPFSSKLGMGVSVSPTSSVGYRITKEETDPSVTEELQRVKYEYAGEGGLNQFKAGLGYSVTKRLSLGVEAVYYLGNIDRSYDVLITSYTGETKNSIYAYETNRISRFFGNFGFQYNAIMTEKQLLTVAATYQLAGKLNPETERMIPSGDIYGNTVAYSSRVSSFKMPDMVNIGVAYQTPKAALVADYSWQGWGTNDNSDYNRAIIRYRNTSSIKVGGEYTPNWMDVRHFMNRITYRAGLRYADYYMDINGNRVAEKAITFGAGIPLKMMGMSSVNVGLEYGQRGSVKPGLIRENYFKFTIGLSLFGEDYWFVKPKYD